MTALLWAQYNCKLLSKSGVSQISWENQMHFKSILMTIKCYVCVSVWLWHSGWHLCVRYYSSSIPLCSLCYHHASGQHQLSKTEGKHQIQACWQFIAVQSVAVLWFSCLLNMFRHGGSVLNLSFARNYY